MSNPLLPPGLMPSADAQTMAKLGIQNPFAAFAPPPATSPSMGFQAWASDPQNNHKVVPSMTAPDAPLQPNSGNQSLASVNPPATKPMASANPPAFTPPDTTQLNNDQAELQRLQSTGAGVNQIQNPFLRGLAKTGDIIAPFLVGGGAAAIPGTTAHNTFLQNRQQARVANDQNAIQQNLQNQKTAQEIQFAPTELDIKKQGASLKGLQAQGTFAQHGLKVVDNGDGTTSVVPDEQSPVYQKQQQQNALLVAQTQVQQANIELRNAQTAYDKAKTDPNSPLFKQAAQRLAIAQQMANSRTQNAATLWDRYLESARGVGPDGQPLAGALITDEGTPVGSAFSQNVRPTGQERGKADLANSAHEQLAAIKGIMQNRPDIFGPVAGRKTDFNVWVGSQDPDAQRFRAARTIAGDHLAGVFGGRSEAALTSLDSAIGQFKDNPKAALAGIDQLDKANNSFIKAGTVSTVGGKSNRNHLMPPKPSGNVIVVSPEDMK